MYAKQSKWFFLIPLALVWGSSFILMKRGLEGLTPIQLGSLRIIFAAVFLVIIGFKSIKQVQIRQWKFIVLTAFVGTFLPVYLFSFAQTQISSSVTAVLNALTPLNTLAIGALVFGIGFQKRQLVGVIIGFIGCTLLILHGAVNNPTQNYYYAVFVLIATICYGTNINLLKRYLLDLSPLSIVTGNFMVLFVPAVIILFFSGFADVIQVSQIQTSVFYVMILGVIGTGIANILFFKLIQISSPVFASSVTYLIPVVAFCWGILDHESISLVQLIGAAIVLTGVYLSSRK